MAWTKEAREKAAATRKERGTLNQYAKAKIEGRQVEISQETREKMAQVWRGRKHSEESKALMSEKASASKHRRLLKSTRVYTKLDGTEVLLDSSWEEALAQRLDSLAIEWIRPSNPIKWVDSTGKSRNYFPDFWLPDQKCFLDPKNPAAFSQQAEKVEWIKNNRSDVVFLHSLDECKNFCLW